MPNFRTINRLNPAPAAALPSRLTLLPLLALSLVLTACGGGGGGASPDFGGSLPSASPTTGTGTGTAPADPVWSIGSGSGTNFTDGSISTSETTLDAGETTTLRVNVVDQARNPPTLGSQNVNFSSTCSSSGLATFGTITEVSPGLFSVTYSNSGCDGADAVTATLGSNGDQATVALTMVGPEVLTVNFVESTVTQLSLAGIGGTESTEVTFKVAGPQGVPVIGKQVSFSINSQVGGASILAGRETGITDQGGLVRTILRSGTVAGPVNVLAVHNETGKQGLSDDIIISTGVPVADRFSMTYNNFNPPRAFNTDGVVVDITIIASDIFGNNPTDGTRVSFVTPESGNVENSCLLENGTCGIRWRSTSPRPADMRATVIAYTDGAEKFTDNNGNSVYDAGDGAILDQGEPYADENENDAYDVGEFFFDTNRNGVRDGGNGLWDGPCLNKVDATAVCTGNKTITVFDTVTVVMSSDTPRLLQMGTFPSPGSTITLAQGNSASFSGMMIADNNTNADAVGSNPPPFGTTIVFSIDGAGVQVKGLASDTVINTTRPVGPYGVTIAADAVEAGGKLPTGVFLNLTITIPDRAAVQYSWPINVTF
jgi:hypothetical protein